MSEFEYRIAALCRDGKVSTGSNSSPDLQATCEFRDQLVEGRDFVAVWVERAQLRWERIA